MCRELRPGRDARDEHDTLTIRRKGGRQTRIALAPATVEALQQYLRDRAGAVDAHPGGWGGPLFASRHGHRLAPKAVWELMRATGIAAQVGDVRADELFDGQRVEQQHPHGHD